MTPAADWTFGHHDDKQSDGWQPAPASRRRRPPAPSRTASPTPSLTSNGSRATSSTSASTWSTRTSRSRGGASAAASSAVSAASTRVGRGHRRPDATRPDVTTLAVGKAVIGTIRSVREFGAFIDCGVSKDGLLHISEVDAPLSVGQRVSVYVKHVDAAAGKLSLSTRAATSIGEATGGARRGAGRGAAGGAAGGAAECEWGRPLERAGRAEWDADRKARAAGRAAERAAAEEAARAARAAHEERRRVREAEYARQAAVAARIAQIEAEMVEEARAREAAAAEAREAAGMSVPMALLVRGEQRVPVAPADAPREVLVRMPIEGRERILYKMPWRGAPDPVIRGGVVVCV